LGKLRSMLHELREIPRLASLVGAQSIARRMFVTNAFDGLLSALGIILGLFVAGVHDPRSYIGAVIGGAGVMGIFSGFIATYLSERAERLRELHETERVMLHSLHGSIYERAARLVPLYVASWSAFGAIGPPLASLTPFFISSSIVRQPIHAVVAESVCIILALMYIMGYYLGIVSGEKPWVSGLRFLLIGASASALLLTLKLLLGWSG